MLIACEIALSLGNSSYMASTHVTHHPLWMTGGDHTSKSVNENLRHNRLRGWRDNKRLPSVLLYTFLRCVHGRFRELLDFEASKGGELPLRVQL